ncbi:MAG: SUMF1/EgtB/PvdO family nonheme iron enzyme [Ardenticatenia bacterium]|nr:SUMF1/EgtB/PvdO family nonheme iron enzyme [Ardenticatenia bacterium]
MVRILAARSELTVGLPRENFLDDCGILEECRGKLHMDAVPEDFAKELVRVLEERGTLEATGYPARVSLLRKLRNDVRGHAKQAAFIDQLLRPYSDEDLNEKLAAYYDDFEGDLADRLRSEYVSLAGERMERGSRTRRQSRMDSAIAGTSAQPVGRPTGQLAQMRQRIGRVEGDHQRTDDGKPERVEDVGRKLMETQRCVVLGEPGSGKTWTMSWLVFCLIDAWDKGDSQARATMPVPIWVPLQSFQGLSVMDNDDYRPQTVHDYIRQCAADLEPHVDRLLAERRLVPVCDALNEMPRREGGKEDGRLLVPEVRVELGKWSRFYVSCRVLDYRDDLREIKELEQISLREFDLPRIHEVIQARFADDGRRGAALWKRMGGSPLLLKFWNAVVEHHEPERFWEPGAVPSYTSGDADEAWLSMHDGARLIPLARNPFLLRVICEIYREDGQIPGNRVALFDRFVTQLLEREADQSQRRGVPWTPEYYWQLEAGLVAVARGMQNLGTTVIKKLFALPAMLTACTEVMSPPDRPLRDALQASILVETGDGVRFSHQLLQEYFAVQVLQQAMDAAEDSDRDPARFFRSGEGWWDPGPWRETTVILGEFLAERALGPNRVARWLAPASPAVALDVILRNGEGLTIDADLEPETRAALIEAAQRKSAESDPRGRAAAWRVLGLLGADARPGVALRADGLPDFRWSAAVAPGKVDFGDLWSKKGTATGERETAEPFRIAVYPVTYAQYRAFVVAPDGYADRRWWDEPERLAHRDDAAGKQEWPIPNHPAENVSWYDSWYDAMAFCRWATSCLRQAGLLELRDDKVIRLPTEAEWQLAAGGRKAKAYPWEGDYDVGRANVDESSLDGGIYLERTTAVGIYPDGEADCGALDMSGNVWEWTLSERSDGSHGDITNDRPRVLRGGSWFDYPGSARASYRDVDHPNLRFRLFGFRVVLAAPVP